MSPTAAAIIGVVLLFGLMILKVPIAFSMLTIGFLGFGYITNFNAGLELLGSLPIGTLQTYVLSTIPLFIFMGQLVHHTGLSRELYYTAYKWVGHLPGGLAMATILGCTGFAACAGDTTSGALTMGSVALPEMRRYGYEPKLATGSVAAGGLLGSLIPPSLSFIIYGMLTEQSVGRLFIAGIFPGLLLSSMYMLSIYVRARRRPDIAPPGDRRNFTERIVALKNVWWVLVIFMVIMGGIYMGIMTPTEAAAVGGFATMVITLLMRRLNRKTLYAALLETIRLSSVTLVIVVGAVLFSAFLAVGRLPDALANFLTGLEISRYFVLAIVLFIYIILGCLMDTLAMILLTIPIVFPVIQALGFDPIWFGVIMALIGEQAMITPPIGVNVFCVYAVAKDVPMTTIFRGIIPFWFVHMLGLLIIIIFPQIATFLPNLMK